MDPDNKDDPLESSSSFQELSTDKCYVHTEIEKIEIVKCEMKEEEVLSEDTQEISEYYSNSDSEVALSVVKNTIESRKTNKNLIKSFIVDSYTSSKIKEEPVEDFNTLFCKDKNLEIEKQQFHKQIFVNIFNSSENIKIKDLQTLYLAKLNEISNVEVFTCSFCSYQTINFTNLRGHLLVIHSKKMQHKMYQCKICNYQDSHSTNLTNHLKLHENTKNKCEDCNYIAPSKRSLRDHFKKHKKTEEDNKCDLCSYEAASQFALKKHKATHRVASNKYKCYKCDEFFRNKARLGRHLIAVHNIETEYGKILAQKVRQYNCSQCEYTTEQKCRLKVHALVHKNPEEIEYFYCSTCTFKTKFKKSLENHQLTHEDPSKRVKTKMCEICSYKCNKPSDLKKHLLTHKSLSELSESEIFSCEKCPYKSKNKDNFKDHLLTHGPPQFTCNMCGYQAKRKQNYNTHMLLHKKSTEIPVYKCPYCPYQSRQKSGYKHHMKQGDHTGKNLKHIPHRFRLENTDSPDFDPKGVRFGPPKKYPKYPRKDKISAKMQDANRGLEDLSQVVTGTHEEMFLNFMATNHMV